MIRIPSFIMGLYLGRKIKSAETISVSLILGCLFGGLIVLAITRHLVYTYMFFVIPIMYLLSILFTKFDGTFVNKIARFYGKISLESYILNGAVRYYAMLIITVLYLKDVNNIVFYLITVLLGTFLSILYNRLSKLVLKNKKNENPN